MNQNMSHFSDQVTSATLLPRGLALLCKNAREPLGVEAYAPRLSWQMKNVARQQEYQIQAAGTPRLLNENHPDMRKASALSRHKAF
jgi:hypothetical protein